MPARTATKSGNWSDVTVWDGGATLPGSGDTADSNGFTVTIDQNVDLSPGGALINTNAGAGGFACSTARTITANITATVRTVLTLSNGAGVTITLGGSITMGATASVAGIQHNGAGNLNITGSVTGGSANNAGINHSSTGTITISGDVSGGNGTLGRAIVNNSIATVTIIGNVTGGSGNSTIGIDNISTGSVSVSLNCTGGSTDQAYGIRNFGTGTVSVNNVIAGTSTTASDRCHGLLGNNSGGVTTFKVATYGASGYPPTLGYCKMLYDQDVNYIRVIRSDTGATVDLSNDYPAAADVKSGTVYKLGTLLGTLAGGGMLQANKRGNKQ